MDPASIVAAAIAVGAAAGLTDTAKQSVVDAYAELKALVTRRYRGIDLQPVETEPDSASERESLADALAEYGVDDDHELLATAETLLEVVSANAPDTAAVIGVDLLSVEAAALRIRNVRSQGTGIRVRDGHFTGDIEIQDVTAGTSEPPHPS